MFESMRRIDRLLEDVETREILARGEYGVLCTVGENGYPYGVPLSYVYSNGTLYFHGAVNAGSKGKNIAYCNKACFTVVGGTKPLPNQFSTLYESVIVFGTVGKVQNPTEKQLALEAIIDKYSGDFREGGLAYIQKMGERADVFALIPQQITGKAKR